MLTAIGRTALGRLAAVRPATRAANTVTLHPALPLRLLQKSFTTSSADFEPTTHAATQTDKPKRESKPRTTSTDAKKTTPKKKPAASKAAADKPTKPKKKAAKKPVKKVLTPEQKATKKEKKAVQDAKDKLKALKQKALKPPPTGSASAWTVYVTEQFAGFGASPLGAASRMAEVAASFKALPAAEVERLNRRANEKKAAQEDAFQAWLSSYPPLQILEANAARKALKRRGVEKGMAQIPDPRLPKRPAGAMLLFMRERHQSGELRHIELGEATKLLAQEWKALSAEEKKVCC
jgi:hypothetical protein